MRPDAADSRRHRPREPASAFAREGRLARPPPDADALAARCEAGALRIVRSGASIARDKAAAETLQRLLVALEAPPVDEAARARLARSLDRHGEQHLILLVRTIIESEGNAAALVEPVISAVSSVMVFHPQWPNRGLEWIERFDNVPLAALLQSLVDLDLFAPGEIGHYYFLVLRNRLRKVFEPPKVPKATRSNLRTQSGHDGR